MASNNTLQSIIDYTRIFVDQIPLVGVGGIQNQPALMNANWVRQFMLAPPFSWRWNRAVETIDITQALGGDYIVQLPNFGWLEKATIQNATGELHEIPVALNLAGESVTNQPFNMSAQLDDSLGNITFRFMPPPDQNYTAVIIYQMASPQFEQLSDKWTPIPDYLSFIYTQGFLAKTYEYLRDERFMPSMQLFLRQLVSTADGLSDSQKDIFLGNKLEMLGELQGNASKASKK